MTAQATALKCPIEDRFDPLSGEYLAAPYGFLREAREAAPAFLARSINHWVVTRHNDIRHVLRTPALFSAVNANSPVVPPCPEAARTLQEKGYGAVPTLANVDPPAHTRVRKIANAAFTPKRVAQMEDVVREIARRFCDTRLKDGEADMVRDLAFELPVIVLFRILGIADSEVRRVKEGSWNRILFIYGRPDEASQVTTAAGLAEFWKYAESLVLSRKAEPRDDFTSAIVHGKDSNGEGLSTAQATTIVLNLLFAGHETTTGLLGNAFHHLLRDGKAWREIVAAPDLIPNAVEEVLRYESSVIAWRRRTTQAVEIGGVAVPKDANLLLLLGSGNRDPEVFPDPDRFDIHRPNARDNLAFGAGPHLCLGAPLARLQARVVLEEVSARLPGLRLKPGCELKFAPNVSFRGPLSLPVQWNA